MRNIRKNRKKRIEQDKEQPTNRGESGQINPDTANHNRTKQSVKDTQILYRALFENANDAIFIAEDDKFIECNPKTFEMFGCTPEQIIGKTPYDPYSPEFQPDGRKSQDKAREKIRLAMQGQPQFFEWRHLRYDGSAFDAEVSLNRLEISGRLCIQAVVRDITKRKKAEKALRKSEEKFNKAFYSSPNAVTISTLKEGRFIAANEAVTQVLGYTSDEIIGKTSAELKIWSLAKDRNKMVEMLKKDGKIQDKEMQFRHKSGGIRHLIVSAETIELEGEDCIVITSTDTTDRKQAEEALRESEERLRLAVQSAKLSTWDWNLLTDEVWLGGYSTEVLGLAPDLKSIPVSYILEHINPEDIAQIWQAVDQAVNEQTMYNEEYRFMRPDGTEFWIAAQGQPVYDKTGKAVRMIGVSQDITERKRAREELERLTAILENTSDLVSTATPDQQLTYLNSAGRKLVGWGDDENLEGKKISDIHPKWAIDLVKTEGIPGAIRDDIWESETAILNPDGKDIPVSQVIMSHKSPNGEVEYLSTIMRDITERKRLEEAYHSLVDNSLQGLAIVQDGRIAFINKAFYSSTDYNKEDFINATPEQFQSIVHPDDRELVWSRHRDRLAGKPVPPRYDCRWIRKDGSTCWLELYASRIEYHGRPAIQVAYIDITERKKAEEALKKSEHRYRTLVEAHPYGIQEINTSGIITYTNPAYQKMVGYTKQELLGKSILDLHEPGSRRDALLDYLSILVKEQPQPTTYFQRNLGKGNRVIDMAIDWNYKRNNEGRVVGFTSVISDITERKLAEEAMKKSSIIIDSTADAVVCTNIGGNITFWNKGAEIIYGYRKEEAIGKPVSILYKDKDLHVLEAMIAELLEGKDIPSIEVTCIDKNQQNVEILLSLTSIRDADGNVTELVGITKDITDRKEADEALRTERDKAQKYLDVAGVMFVLIDKNGKVNLVNKKGCEILGYKESEIIGKSWFDTFLPEQNKDKVKEVFYKIIIGGIKPVEYFENPVLTKDGEERLIAWHNTILRDSLDNIIGTLSSGEDITERKKAEQKLLGYQKRLKSLASELLLAEERERRRIATGVHDDIGQKLALAKLELQSMQAIVTEPDVSESLGHACELIDKGMQDARSLAFDLSNPVLYEVGFVAAVESLLTEQMIQKSGIKSEFKSKTRKLKLGQDMSIVLFQAVRELLTNVVKHAKANKVKVCIDKSDNRVHVIVEDDGAGFELLKLQSPDRKKGGFGLFNVKERLEYLGGSFDIKSKPRQGTRVIMAVPLEPGIMAS